MPLKDLRKRLERLATESRADGYVGFWMRMLPGGELELRLSAEPNPPAGDGWEAIKPANADRLQGKRA
jgi:hypothetical protein